MWLVAIETSGRIGSVAVARDGTVALEHQFEPGPRHGRDILPAIAGLLERLGLTRTDVDAVGVSLGPGSFTGLRIGASCAKTLAWSLGWALIGVPTMEVLAQNAGEREGFVCPLIDARRKFVYTGIFESREGRWRPVGDLLIGPPAEVATKLPERAFIFGDAIRTYPRTFTAERFEIGREELIVGRARHVAALAHERFLAGERRDPLRLVPEYYRRTEAEENLAKGEADQA